MFIEVKGGFLSLLICGFKMKNSENYEREMEKLFSQVKVSSIVLKLNVFKEDLIVFKREKYMNIEV